MISLDKRKKPYLSYACNCSWYGYKNIKLIVWDCDSSFFVFSLLAAYQTMANLREIKGKIKSVQNLKKITRALEVVSTVKLQKTKQKADSLKDYLIDFLWIYAQVSNIVDAFGKENEASWSVSDKKLVIVLTSERWLCGALNSKLLRKIYQHVWFDDSIDYFVVGKKWLEYLKRAKANIVGSLHLADSYGEEDLLPLYTYFDQAVASGAYGEVHLYFNYFKNSITQIPTSVQLLPFTQDSLVSFLTELELHDLSEEMQDVHTDKELLIEPDMQTYVLELRRQIRNYVINAALIQNKTGEHAARMIAMKNAKDNASDFAKKLKLNFNKARQGAITQEISEIVSAKIAIEG